MIGVIIYLIRFFFFFSSDLAGEKERREKGLLPSELQLKMVMKLDK